MNPYLSKLQREKLESEINQFFAKGGQVQTIGFQMQKKAPPLVLDAKREYEPKKLPPSFTRNSYQ